MSWMKITYSALTYLTTSLLPPESLVFSREGNLCIFILIRNPTNNIVLFLGFRIYWIYQLHSKNNFHTNKQTDISRRMHHAKSCRGDKILSPQHVAWIQDDLNSCDMSQWQRCVAMVSTGEMSPRHVPAICRLVCRNLKNSRATPSNF